MLCWFFPVAIAAGSTAELRRSERDPSALMWLARLWQETGLPDGVFNMLNGSCDHRSSRRASATIMPARMITDPKVKTGSAIEGRHSDALTAFLHPDHDMGMLMGAIDDAVGVIHIDRVTGPPPDSFLSASFFQHGSAGTQAAVGARLEGTDALSANLGLRHPPLSNPLSNH